jgi:predicted Zn-dependent peptidase
LIPVLCDETMKIADGFEPAELARAKAQMKAGLLMSLESSSARCEQLAQHLLIHGTPFDAADLVRRIDAVDDAAIARVVASWRAAAPTLVALGPLGRLEDFERLRGRLGV